MFANAILPVKQMLLEIALYANLQNSGIPKHSHVLNVHKIKFTTQLITYVSVHPHFHIQILQVFASPVKSLTIGTLYKANVIDVL